MELNSFERETIGLCISMEAIKDMVNHALLKITPYSDGSNEAEIYFHDFTHRSLFLIRFLDFAKECGDRKLTGVSGSCISVLEQATLKQSYNDNGSINELEAAISNINEWLEFESPLKLWLPTLDIEAKINVSRHDILKVSGNHSKHNLSRLTAVSKTIHKLLLRHGYDVDIQHIPLALEDFQEHLEQNYFIYYGTWMAQLLNDLLWGIQRYLEPEYRSSYTPKGDMGSYRFIYPKKINNKISEEWYWRLMNNVRSGPIFHKFKAPEILRKTSSLERDWKSV